jgi:MFS family permease
MFWDVLDITRDCFVSEVHIALCFFISLVFLKDVGWISTIISVGKYFIPPTNPKPMRSGYRFILLMGLVSLFGDITYEGARSVIGPYLSTFAINAFTLGIVIGIGEFAGYSLRLLTGYLADRSKRYWLLTFLGYGMIISIPLLAFANSWTIVAVLIIVERIGKAIRSPSRDAIISFATRRIGFGTGFGIHEAMDQIGAFIGPIIFFAVLYMGFEYREGFLMMFIPVILAMLMLRVAKSEYTSLEDAQKEPTGQRFAQKGAFRNAGNLSKQFWMYTLFTFFAVMGFTNFQLISYHFKVESIFSDSMIPILYSVAMGVDAFSALITGRLFDKIGLNSLALIPVLTPLVVLLAFLVSPWVGILMFGVVLGMHETIMRAGVAKIVHSERRATAYGIFNTASGLAFFVGSVILGALYDVSVHYLVIFSTICQIIALVVLSQLKT